MTLLLSHNDLDGQGALILSFYFGLRIDNFYICDYKDREYPEYKNMFKAFDKIIFTDFSPTKDHLIELLEMGKNVEIYDHHLSSEELLEVRELYKGNLVLVHDKERSGTKIFYEEYLKNGSFEKSKIKESVNKFVNLVNVYDLYLTDNPIWNEALNLNRVLYGMLSYKENQYNKYKKFIANILNKLYNNSVWVWSEEENKIIERDQAKENRLFENALYNLKERVDDRGNKFGLFTESSKISILCHRILKERKDLKYVICINTYSGEDGTGWKKLSARSRNEEEFNTLDLEGFNGHKCASGRECEIEFSKCLYAGEIPDIRYRN
jgi:oligoribonuclease NrnB/cAMP/cGMP phosphodiesterase (DHH superfamily)